MPSEEIYKWLKAHKLIKWATLCNTVGIDKSNFQKSMMEGKELNLEYEKKIREVLEGYGLPKVAAQLQSDLHEVGKAVYKTDEKGEVTRIDPLSRKADLIAQIAAIKAEKIPKERDTVNGRKVWLLDQKKRIEPLQKELDSI